MTAPLRITIPAGGTQHSTSTQPCLLVFLLGASSINNLLDEYFCSLLFSYPGLSLGLYETWLDVIYLPFYCRSNPARCDPLSINASTNKSISHCSSPPTHLHPPFSLPKRRPLLIRGLHCDRRLHFTTPSSWPTLDCHLLLIPSPSSRRRSSTTRPAPPLFPLPS